MHFDIDPDFSRKVRRGLESFNINGRQVKVNEAEPRKDSRPKKYKKSSKKKV